MFDLHIEDFYKDCAKALISLYGQFPRKTILFVEDVAGPDQPDEYGVHSERFQSGFGALIWLSQEGFLAFESTIRQEALDQAILSAKGLHMLSCIAQDDYLHALVDSITTKAEGILGQPKVAVLKHISKHGTSSQLSLAMQHLLKQNA